MGTVVWVLQLTDGRGHRIRHSRTDKECVEPYFHHFCLRVVVFTHVDGCTTVWCNENAQFFIGVWRTD